MNAVTSTIQVSLGETRYVGGTITEATGKDISADTILMGLGDYDTPPAKTAGKAPDVDEPGDTSASRVVKLLIDDNYTAGKGLYVWGWIADNPEVTPVRVQGPIAIA